MKKSVFQNFEKSEIKDLRSIQGGVADTGDTQWTLWIVVLDSNGNISNYQGVPKYDWEDTDVCPGGNVPIDYNGQVCEY